MKRKIKLNNNSLQLEGPIITWYNQLQNTKVAELEFHQHRPLGIGSRSSSRIILSLTDGSKYLLQRRVKHANGALVPDIVDTIRNISASSIATLPLIRVKFVEKSGECPDLLFVLSVCHGIQSYSQKDQIARFFIDDEFFSLAVILNVTRTSPPLSQIPKPTPVETLWRDVYLSIQSQEHTFWGHTIADEAKNITRELIYRTARDKIAGSASQPQNDPETNRSIAASIVARVESLIKKRELNDSNTWDDAWNECWDAQWQDFNVEEWTIPLREILPIEHIPGAIQLTVEGRVPGSIAGRTPERYNMPIDGSTWLHSILMGSHPPHNGRDAHPSPPSHTPLGGNQNYEIWASPREIAVHEAWNKAWTLAVNKGKAIAQEVLDIQPLGAAGQSGGSKKFKRIRQKMSQVVKATLSARNKINRVPTQNRKQPQNNAPLANTNAPPVNTLPSHRRRSSAAQALRTRFLGPGAKYREEIERELIESAKERTYREKKEMARLQAKKELSSDAKPPPNAKAPDSFEQQLKLDAQKAWEEKKERSGGLETKLNSLAEQAWQNVTENSGHPISDDSTKNKWKDRFKNTWEQAWKEAWAKAWKAVWNEAWDAAVARGAEFGVEEVFDKDPNMRRANYEDLRSKQSYTEVQELINQGDYLACLEQVRSMMKELYHLYESLQHSIPVYRDEARKITGFEKDNTPKLGVKKFRPRRYVEERRPTHLSYYELQEWVHKHYIEPKFPDNKNGQKLFKRRIAQVWGTALSAYNASKKGTTTARIGSNNPRPTGISPVTRIFDNFNLLYDSRNIRSKVRRQALYRRSRSVQNKVVEELSSATQTRNGIRRIDIHNLPKADVDLRVMVSISARAARNPESNSGAGFMNTGADHVFDTFIPAFAFRGSELNGIRMLASKVFGENLGQELYLITKARYY